MSHTPPPGPESSLPAERPSATPPDIWQQPPEDPYSGGQPIDYRRYLAVLWHFKWLILLVTVLGTGAGIVATRFLKPQYEAHASILIESRSGGRAGQGPIQPTELFQSYGSWLDLLKSRPVLDSVVVGLRLYVRADSATRPRVAGLSVTPEYNPGRYRFSVSADGQSFTLTADDGRLLQDGALGDSVGQELGFLWAPSAEQFEPGMALEFALGNVAGISDGLAGRIRGEVDRATNFMFLTYRGGNAQRTAAVLNAVADRFVEVASELRRDKLAATEAILATQRSKAEEDLQNARAELERFRVRTATLPTEPGYPINPGLAETSDPAWSIYRNLKREQGDVQADRDVIERALAQAADSGLAIVAVEGVASRHSAELVAALSDLTQKRAGLQALRNRYLEDHVLIRQAREALGNSEQRAIELARLLIDQLAAEDRRLERQIATAAGELGEIPIRAIQEDALEQRVQSAEAAYSELQARHDEALLAEASNMPDVQVFSRAVPSPTPTNAKDRKRLMMVASLASLALGVGLAILLYNMDPRVKSPDELGRLGLRILGTVPHVNTGRPAETLRNADAVVESFRLIRLNVTHAHGTAGPIVLAVTSPTGSEGKSFVASNLGLAFSHLGLRTLVIDADVRRGRVHRLLGGTRRPGLTDYLGGVASLEQVVKSTQHKALYRIASGTRRQGAPELLQSSAMVSLVADLRSSFDVLIIDTPPIGVGADALALAALAGNLVVVVRTGSTNRELTEAKLEFLFRMPVRVLGAILNDVPARGVYGYYGSPYYSSYLPGYESKDEEESASLSGD